VADLLGKDENKLYFAFLTHKTKELVNGGDLTSAIKEKKRIQKSILNRDIRLRFFYGSPYKSSNRYSNNKTRD